MKLYPPYIEGTIPAFYTDSEGTVLTVPFSMNRAVNINQVEGFQLKMKEVQSNRFLFTLTTFDKPQYVSSNNYIIKFSIPDVGRLSQGDFYKIQMSYISLTGEIGYFSTVSIAKYTTKPAVYIDNLSANINNNHVYVYNGVYSQKGKDVTEKVYSYQFILIDQNENIIDDTGIQIHDNLNNKESYSAVIEYKYTGEIPKNEIYYLQFIVNTNNNIKIASPCYPLVYNETQNLDMDIKITPSLNVENGYVNISLLGDISEYDKEFVAFGNFIITRACQENNYNSWDEIFNFNVNNQYLSAQVLRDFTVEHNKTYVYAIQKKLVNGTYSTKIISKPVLVIFDYTFLYDGYKQLKLKFNPKINTFKLNNLETKTDTMGSKYPFIYRNNNVQYKEIALSSLISYLSDEEELFITEEELNIGSSATIRVKNGKYNELSNLDIYDKITKYSQIDINDEIIIGPSKNNRIRTVALEDYSIAAERAFKLAVLKWLNNGQIKLLRSPTEGNFLIYLTNVSFAPEDRLNRLIHTFSATGYQIDNYTYSDLITYNIVKVKQSLLWGSIELSTTIQPSESIYEQVDNIWFARGRMILDNKIIKALYFNGVTPNAEFIINFKNGEQQRILIGATRNYVIDIDKDIIQITIPSTACYSGIISYSYYERKE